MLKHNGAEVTIIGVRESKVGVLRTIGWVIK